LASFLGFSSALQSDFGRQREIIIEEVHTKAKSIRNREKYVCVNCNKATYPLIFATHRVEYREFELSML
jgi:hypothetical protein